MGSWVALEMHRLDWELKVRDLWFLWMESDGDKGKLSLFHSDLGSLCPVACVSLPTAGGDLNMNCRRHLSFVKLFPCVPRQQTEVKIEMFVLVFHVTQPALTLSCPLT